MQVSKNIMQELFLHHLLTLYFHWQCKPQCMLQDSFWCNPQNCTEFTAYRIVLLLVLAKGNGCQWLIILSTTMISGDMLHVFLLIIEARVYVISSFPQFPAISIISCCLLIESIGQTIIKFLYVIQECNSQKSSINWL